MLDNAPRLTLSGLLPLIASCINLRELTIRVDTLNTIPDAAQLRNIIPTLKLQELDASRSPANDDTSISSFIQTVFPNLQTLRDKWDLDGPELYELDPVEEANRRCWVDVRQQLGLL